MYFTKADIEKRRQRLLAKWNEILSDDEAVVVSSGEPIQKPGGLDQTYSFLPHPAYFWLTGRRRESEVVLYNKNSGFIEFQKPVPPEEAVWEGERHDLLVDEKGESISTLQSFLDKNRFATTYRLGQGAVIEGKAFDLRTAFDQTRRVKDDAEVRLIKNLAEIAVHGYRKITEVVEPGITERAIQVAYEGEILNRGAHGVPYESIVGSGPNSAILHALPTHRKVQEGEFVLIDAGAEIYDYCVDITRVLPSSSNMSQQHRDLYQLVLKAYSECIAMSKPGVLWRDVHIHAAKVITEGLRSLNILKGSFDELVQKEASSVFFPHGVGHLVGLRVRDTGQEENIHPKLYAGARLRVDITLEEGHCITVEPGCYFISSLLDDANIRGKYKDAINWTEVEKWKGIGGVRIEDDILITASGNENLTKDVEKTSGL
jgi:Xaa-Pro dipeptidase